MNGTIRYSRFALGTVALLALAAGCNKQKPAQQPTPTFESRASEPAPATQAPGYEQNPSAAQPGMNEPGMNQPGTTGSEMGTQPGTAGQGTMGTENPSAGTTGQTGTDTGTSASSSMSEREMCDSLTRDSAMRVEDIQGGVAIVLTAKASSDLSTVRDDARRVERAMTPEGASPGATQTAPSEGERCALFDLGRLGARAVISEGPNSIRILFTSTDQQSIKSMRRQARDFAKSSKGTSGHGTMKSPSGGTQSPSGGTRP